MVSRIDARFQRLEEAARLPGRLVVIDEGKGDVKEQIRRMREAGELSDNDEIVILSHF